MTTDQIADTLAALAQAMTTTRPVVTTSSCTCANCQNCKGRKR